MILTNTLFTAADYLSGLLTLRRNVIWSLWWFWSTIYLQIPLGYVLRWDGLMFCWCLLILAEACNSKSIAKHHASCLLGNLFLILTFLNEVFLVMNYTDVLLQVTHVFCTNFKKIGDLNLIFVNFVTEISMNSYQFGDTFKKFSKIQSRY